MYQFEAKTIEGFVQQVAVERGDFGRPILELYGPDSAVLSRFILRIPIEIAFKGTKPL